MQSVSKGVLDLLNWHQKDTEDEGKNDNRDSHFHSSRCLSTLALFTGTRVAELERDETSLKWKLRGTSGKAVFHETPENLVQQSNKRMILDASQGYDGIILKHVSHHSGNGT